MAKFVSIPAECEAVLYDGTPASVAEIRDFCGHWVDAADATNRGRLMLTTPSGAAVVHVGDWVCKAGPADFYPCNPDVFARRWRAAD